MTPFRSCIVILNTALAVAILGELQLKGGVTTYAVVSCKVLICHDIVSLLLCFILVADIAPLASMLQAVGRQHDFCVELFASSYK